jgi:hypothetical protein
MGAKQKVDAMYDMYRAIERMDIKVFDMYHDMMSYLYDEASSILCDDEQEDEQLIDKMYKKMRAFLMSAKHMDIAFKTY